VTKKQQLTSHTIVDFTTREAKKMTRLALKLVCLCIVLHCISGSLQSTIGNSENTATEGRTDPLLLTADMKAACIKALVES